MKFKIKNKKLILKFGIKRKLIAVIRIHGHHFNIVVSIIVVVATVKVVL